eukprot:GHVU01034031.1.p1 GENE.GHVU01034031.1~~GHVU01034031.1.p1  ORF type:complete len:234 (+),score=34.05 GHVU01034031.1:985-1686(+)
MEKITDLVGDLIPPGEAGPEVEAMLGRDIPPQSVPHVVATATNDEANIIVDVPSNVLYANDGRIPQISIAPASDFSKSSPNTATKLEYVIPEAIEEETEAVVDEIQKHQQFMPTQYVDHAIPQGYAMQPPTTELQQQMMAPPQMDAYGAPPPEMQMQMQMQQPEQFQGMMAPTPQVSFRRLSVSRPCHDLSCVCFPARVFVGICIISIRISPTTLTSQIKSWTREWYEYEGAT